MKHVLAERGVDHQREKRNARFPWKEPTVNVQYHLPFPLP